MGLLYFLLLEINTRFVSKRLKKCVTWQPRSFPPWADKMSTKRTSRTSSMLSLKSSKSSSRNFPERASKNSSPKVPKSWLPCQQVAEELPLLLPLAVLPLPKKRRRRRKKKNPRNLTTTWDSVFSINSLHTSLY